ncbi:MAG: GNAT family N-acetyltransferase, partial [Stackebrandtia sp.]
MDATPFTTGPGGDAVMITRVADGQWHALDDDLVVGRGYAAHRPDGRLFAGIDAWHDATFDRLAEAMLAELPAPLYT